MPSVKIKTATTTKSEGSALNTGELGLDSAGKLFYGFNNQAVRVARFSEITKSNVGLSNVANERQYSASNPPPYPVTSVGGKTGEVYLRSAVSGPSIIATTAYAKANYRGTGAQNEGVLLQGFPAPSTNPRMYFFRVQPIGGGTATFCIVGYNQDTANYATPIQLQLESDKIYCMISAGDKIYHLCSPNTVTSSVQEVTSSWDWYLVCAGDETATQGNSGDFYVSYISFLI